MDLGGHLVSIHSQDENDFVTASGGAGAYIGATDAAAEGTYVWTDGTPLDYTNWLPGEPNDFTGEDCAQINDSSGGWNDIPCDGGAHFVCKL